VDDKIHGRVPSAVLADHTQQPLGGKAQFGGQRLPAKWKVWRWKLTARAFILQNCLPRNRTTFTERTKIYEAIVKGEARDGAGRAGIVQRADSANCRLFGLDVEF